MANWRAKYLSLAEWSELQEQFEALQLAAGGPENLAMFAKSALGSTSSTIYLTGPGIAAIEALSPDGWADAEMPSGEGVSLLVGSGDPWSLIGIDKPA